MTPVGVQQVAASRLTSLPSEPSENHGIGRHPARLHRRARVAAPINRRWAMQRYLFDSAQLAPAHKRKKGSS